MLNELVILFAAMDWITIVLLCVGMAMVIVEMFIPGFGFFGIAGIICLVLGMIMQAVNTKSGNPLAQFLLLLLLIVLILGTVFGVFAVLVHKGKFKRSFLFKEESALPVDMTEVNVDYTDLLGKSGVVVANLRPIGVALIDGKRYDVTTRSTWVEVGAKVRVVAVEDNDVIVETVTDENN